MIRIDCGNSNSLNKCRKQIASAIAFDKTIYSNSVDERATNWFFIAPKDNTSS